MANQILKFGDVAKELATELSKMTPAEQMSFVYMMQTANGFPHDTKQLAAIKAAFEEEGKVK